MDYSTATTLLLWTMHVEQVKQLADPACLDAYETRAPLVLEQLHNLLQAPPADGSTLLTEKVPLQLGAAWCKALSSSAAGPGVTTLQQYAAVSLMRFLHHARQVTASNANTLFPSLAKQLQQSGLLQLLPDVYTAAAQTLAGFTASIAAGKLQCSDAPCTQFVIHSNTRRDGGFGFGTLSGTVQHQQDWLFCMHMHIKRLLLLHGLLQRVFSGLPKDQQLDILPDGSTCIAQLAEAVLRLVSVCTQQISSRGQVPPSDLLDLAHQAISVFVSHLELMEEAVTDCDQELEQLLHDRPSTKQLLTCPSYLFCLAASCLVAALSGSSQATPAPDGNSDRLCSSSSRSSDGGGTSSSGGSHHQYSTAAGSSSQQQQSGTAQPAQSSGQPEPEADGAAAWEFACKLSMEGGVGFELAGQCGIDGRVIASVVATGEVCSVQPWLHIVGFAYLDYLTFCEKHHPVHQQDSPQGSLGQRQQGQQQREQSAPLVASEQQQQQHNQRLHLAAMSAMLQRLATTQPAKGSSLWLHNCTGLIDSGRRLLRLSQQQGWWDQAASVLECSAQEQEQQQQHADAVKWPEEMLSSALQVFNELLRQYQDLDSPGAAAAGTSSEAPAAAADARCAMGAAAVDSRTPAAAAHSRANRSSSNQSRSEDKDSQQQQQQEVEEEEGEMGDARHKSKLLSCMSGLVVVCSSIMECCVITGMVSNQEDYMKIHVKNPWPNHVAETVQALEQFVRTAAVAGEAVTQHVDADSRLMGAFKHIWRMCAVDLDDDPPEVGLLAACAFSSAGCSITPRHVYTLLVSMQKAAVLPDSSFRTSSAGSCLLTAMEMLRVLFIFTSHEASSLRQAGSREVVHSLLSCLVVFGRLCLGWAAMVRRILELQAIPSAQAGMEVAAIHDDEASSALESLEAVGQELHVGVALLELFAEVRAADGTLPWQEVPGAPHKADFYVAATVLKTVFRESARLASFASNYACTLSMPSTLQLLAAAGYDAAGLQQQLGTFAEAMRQHAASDVSMNVFGSLQQSCQNLGLALNALAVPWACNNPTCSNLSGPSELSLVSGKSCMCAGCRVAHYCCRRCQRLHWQQHKPVCKALAAAQMHAV